MTQSLKMVSEERFKQDKNGSFDCLVKKYLHKNFEAIKGFTSYICPHTVLPYIITYCICWCNI